jgi:hypothetical protein
VAVIDGVIQITEEQYQQYQQGGIRIRRSTGEDVDLRKLSGKIIHAALSFKDVVSTVVTFDPTHHAACAWAVISLGLTVRTPELILENINSMITDDAKPTGITRRSIRVVRTPCHCSYRVCLYREQFLPG